MIPEQKTVNEINALWHEDRQRLAAALPAAENWHHLLALLAERGWPPKQWTPEDIARYIPSA